MEEEAETLEPEAVLMLEMLAVDPPIGPTSLLTPDVVVSVELLAKMGESMAVPVQVLLLETIGVVVRKVGLTSLEVLVVHGCIEVLPVVL